MEIYPNKSKCCLETCAFRTKVSSLNEYCITTIAKRNGGDERAPSTIVTPMVAALLSIQRQQRHGVFWNFKWISHRCKVYCEAKVLLDFSYLHMVDNAHPHRDNIVEHQESEDNLVALHFKYDQARRRFVEWAQNKIAVVPDFHKRILFSDEAHFWLNGYVNKQNCRIWSEANPQVYVETPLHPEKLTVWCALWAGGILLQKR
ncbi:hypothetical protein TNCV_2104141 [Trichonephila clavipes]|nr:hypothetical protein TNCV_2104141 [Trichonephila clavipes]